MLQVIGGGLVVLMRSRTYRALSIGKRLVKEIDLDGLGCSGLGLLASNRGDESHAFLLKHSEDGLNFLLLLAELFDYSLNVFVL